MMIFGRSLFGGTTSGHVLVVGLASALVSAVAVPEVTRPVHGTGYAQSVVQAEALKSLIPDATHALGTGYASGAALVEFSGYVAAEALASGYGKGTADYLLAGDALAQFNYLAIASKRTRAPYALAWANASGEADAQIYEYAYGTSAIGKATGIGTTYHVGQARGTPFATGTAAASVIAGARTQGLATATVEGECRRAGGAAGLATGVAFHQVDASVTREEIREFELFGVADCTSSATVAHVGVYQLQTTEAYAYGSLAVPVHTKGGKGAVALAESTARGIALGTATGAAAMTGDSITTATGRATYRFGALGNAGSVSNAGANAAGDFRRSGMATALSDLAVQHIDIGVIGSPAGAEATGSVEGLRTVHASSDAFADAQATGFIQVNDLGKAPDDRTVVLVIEDRLVSVEAQPRLILI